MRDRDEIFSIIIVLIIGLFLVFVFPLFLHWISRYLVGLEFLLSPTFFAGLIMIVIAIDYLGFFLIDSLKSESPTTKKPRPDRITKLKEKLREKIEKEKTKIETPPKLITLEREIDLEILKMEEERRRLKKKLEDLKKRCENG